MRISISAFLLVLLSIGSARADASAGEAAYSRGDFAAALEAWSVAAAEGDADAQYGLGRLYFYGQGVERDPATAAEWYRKAALQGHARSQTNLGYLYETGQGVERGFAEAARWYRSAAENGRAVAQRSLGRLYEEGLGVERDLAEAIRWYEEAAALGDEEAHAALARVAPAKAEPRALGSVDAGEAAFARGDYGTAIANWRPLAEAGNAEAAYRLADLYRLGLGLSSDLAEAGRWYRRAADLGQAEAMYHLAFLYFRGRGVTTRPELGLAHGWFSLAAERGVGDAPEWRDRLAKKLTPKEREQSANLVREHAPSPPGP